jgi:hypothetical protein
MRTLHYFYNNLYVQKAGRNFSSYRAYAVVAAVAVAVVEDMRWADNKAINYYT